ncbi:MULTISPECIES: Crp/Fnr family transcriptional regulator [unclassified Sporosarcina]|uniref:Crp/Fnr family transcriptional regulator n=1 Tax=unclassified Sporosarcina TaxID=2647733 RepID=UPI00203DDB8F|nr:MULTISPECIES: Crp/Fnr family transcriptional regulator [unclassified Sporosarcina]GKV65257.1 transcriptional regulator [Sporosarcina sp. NCCP-2331]GLB55381.1 transcriptional regulator [Sporosarcina sp. NCCP-2378]
MFNQKHSWENFILEGYGLKRKFEKNTTLFHQGEIGEGFYYLSKGEVKISLLSSQGNERDIDYVIPGRLLGEQGFYKNPYFTTAVTTAPSTLYFFSKDEFNQLCLDLPEAASIFMDSLIMKVRLLAEATTILNAPAEYRLAHFLYKLHRQKGETKIKISQITLARFIGTSRITVYKVINEWKEKRMIEHRQGYIFILDINKLMLYLDEDPVS